MIIKEECAMEPLQNKEEQAFIKEELERSMFLVSRPLTSGLLDAENIAIKNTS